MIKPLPSSLVAISESSLSLCKFFQHQFCANDRFECRIECPEILLEGNLDFDEEFSIPLHVSVNGIIAFPIVRRCHEEKEEDEKI